MKISKIAKLCKDSKLVTMTQTGNGLWVGNGYAVYLLPEFTYLDQNGIALAFGLAEKDKGKIRFTEIKPDVFNLEDIDETETPCEMLSFLFSTEKGTVRPYKTQEVYCFSIRIISLRCGMSLKTLKSISGTQQTAIRILPLKLAWSCMQCSRLPKLSTKDTLSA